jgi:hypothetical protein
LSSVLSIRRASLNAGTTMVMSRIRLGSGFGRLPYVDRSDAATAAKARMRGRAAETKPNAARFVPAWIDDADELDGAFA